MTSGRASGKIILFGEHAVVYGQPAIAVPVAQVAVQVHVTPARDRRSGIWLRSPEVQLDSSLADLPADHPVKAGLQLIFEKLDVEPAALDIEIESTIPIAAGLGSGAAVTIALARALGAHHERPLSRDDQSRIAFEVDRLHHGTPSGIDNTVIALGQPIYFVKGQDPSPFQVGVPVPLVIADSGIPSPTSEAVALVRERWLNNRLASEDIFDAIGHISKSARRQIAAGEIESLGPAMNANHRLLQRLGVSTAELDTLVAAARAAGAHGAKLSGAGLGGNVIALSDPDDVGDISGAFLSAGAVSTISTVVEP